MSLRRLATTMAALLAVVLVASACGGGGGDQAAQTVTIEWGEPENPIIPGSTNEDYGYDAVNALFVGLVKFRASDAAPQLANAESITPSPDQRTFTIRLKPGWQFHDGTPVTAQSYVDAWNWTAAGPTGAQNQSFMEKIEGYDQVSTEQPTTPTMSGLRVVDPQTFTVTLKAPFAIFPTTLGYTAYFPLPQKFFTDRAGYEAAPVGNGPFRFESRTPNQELTLLRYDQYQGAEKAQIPRLVMRVYSSIETAYDDLVSNNVDYVRQVPPNALTGNKWRTDLGDRAVSKPGLANQTLFFPLYDPRFANPLLRKAISMSIDRATIAAQVFGGSRVPSTGLVVPGTEGYVPGQCGEFCTFNPQRAQQLLAQAGGFQGPLTLTANSDGGHDEWMQAAANNIRQTLGIDAQYTPVPSFSDQRRLANSQQITGLFRTGWVADYPNIESFVTQQFRTGGSANDARYSNPAVDAALDRADAAPTVPAADAGYAEAERLILNDLPAIPIFDQPIQAGRSARTAAGDSSPLRHLDVTTLRLAPQGG